MNYYQKHKNDRIEYQKKYYKTTKEGKASQLLNGYKKSDILYDRGECTLTYKWIVDNILSKPCAHCGESDWTKIGCNRLNDDLPHTPDNVEPCCLKCNLKIQGAKKSKKVYQYNLIGELVGIWASAYDAERKCKVSQQSINNCCRGKQKTSGGFKWSYKILN